MAGHVHGVHLRERRTRSRGSGLSSTAFEIVRELAPLSRVFSSPGYDRAAERLGELLPFTVHVYSGDEDVLGWVIPPRWEATRATVARRDTGEIVYDGTRHALGVISLSAPFAGTVSAEELRRHLHYDHRNPDVLPFHFRQSYRPWDRTWGLCVPKTLYDAIEDGEYEVVIETNEGPGDLKVLEHVHAGERPESFAFVAHLDHPGMANDDLAGCAVGVELFQRLQGRKTKFTYRLLLLQEIVGSVYWWTRTNRANSLRVFESLFLEMLGSDTQLALQSSLDGATILEKAVEQSLHARAANYRVAPFGRVITNDEYIWESFGVPMASLSRFPYPEYHTDRDDISIISVDRLQEAVGALSDAIDALERTTLIIRRFEGTPCLSNPRYDLYVDPGQPAFGDVPGEAVQRLRLLMEVIPTLRRPTAAATLAQRVDLPEADVIEYARRWADRGLLDLV